jgi:uncharacterized protein (UPF0276 family)
MLFAPPRLGPGAIYLRALDGFFRANGDLIKVAEIEPQVLCTKGTAEHAQPRGSPQERRHLRTLPQRILTHGVGNPVGGTICDQVDHVREFRAWNAELAAPWTSEHLSILRVRGARGPEVCGFLMPPLQTDAAVKLAARNIRERAAVLGLPFAFETGVNYFALRDDEMSDGDFFAAVADEADCGIVLDLANLWINQRNGRAKVADVVSRLPLERVWEVHLAGGELERGFWVDAHSGGVDPGLAEFARDLVCELPNLGALIFELASDRVSLFGAESYLEQMETVNRLWERVPLTSDRATSRAGLPRPAASPAIPTPEMWEDVLARQMLPLSARPAASGASFPLAPTDEERFSLYLHLASSFRTGAIADLLPNTIRLLLMAVGRPALTVYLEQYIAVTPPASFPTDEVLRFRHFVDSNPPGVPGLDELLKFEAMLIEAAADGVTIRASFTKNIDAMLTEIASGILPGPASDIPPTMLEIGVNPVPFVRTVDAERTATA